MNKDLLYIPTLREFKGTDILEELRRRLYKDKVSYISFLNRYEADIANEMHKLNYKEKIDLSEKDTYLIKYNMVISSYDNLAFAVSKKSYEEMSLHLENVDKARKENQEKLERSLNE